MTTIDDILGYMHECIYKNYMIAVLITSASKGKLHSIGIDYGVGKSTLQLYMMFTVVRLCMPTVTEEEAWEKVFSMLHAFPWELEDFFQHAPTRYPGDPIFFAIDDLQRCFGKDKSKDPYIRGIRNRFTTSRPQMAVLLGTAPDIGELAYPIRYLFNFEIKVPERGKYEVQRLRKWSDFANPYQTRVQMQYFGESPYFPKLPDDVQKRYDDWRAEVNRRFDEGEGDIKLRSIQNVLSDSAKELLKQLNQKGSYTRQMVITEMEQGQDLKLLQNCGLVEVFGDVVVPTKQARKIITIL